MTDYDTYGTSTHTAAELVRLVSDRLGLVFAEHDSYYRGGYYLASSPSGELEIQPNPIPGDDGDLYAPEHPTIQVLLLTTTPSSDLTLRTRLGSVEGLIQLHHEKLFSFRPSWLRTCGASSPNASSARTA